MRGWLAVPLFLLLSAPARGQQAERQAAKEGQEAYDNGDYVAALHKFERAEEGVALLDPPEQVLVYRYHAYCLVTLDRTEEARAEFRKMLKVDPDLDLDPAQVPPKILGVFREVRAAVQPLPPSKARLYSALAPGLGQYKTGRDRAALEFASGTVLALGLAIYSQSLASTAEGYVGQAGPSDVSKFRAQATRYDLQRDAAVAALVGVWVWAALDAGHNAPRPHPARMVLAPTGEGVALAVRF